jgi:primosomal protein N' (replication factor Y)
LQAGSFDGADADLYVTTWFGTKPVLRPQVALVVILDADSLIRAPDFRAAENAYRALVDMAEWAGPASAGGRLLVQTQDASHHAIQALARADYWFFLNRELAFRRDPAYPPFTELIKVHASGRDHLEMLRRVGDACAGLGARVLGPIEVRRRVAGGLERGAELLIKHADAQEVAESLRGILRETPPDTRLRVDVDPR